MSSKVKHIGGCHCGRVEYQVFAPETITVIKCNCSICRFKQNLHFIVPDSDFKLLKGSEVLTEYSFNTNQAKHPFCSICGVQSFYQPRSNPDGKGIMPHCIKSNTLKEILTETFNGENWEDEILKKQNVVNMSKKK